FLAHPQAPRTRCAAFYLLCASSREATCPFPRPRDFSLLALCEWLHQQEAQRKCVKLRLVGGSITKYCDASGIEPSMPRHQMRFDREPVMDTKPTPFVPPAPKPRTKPPTALQMMRI